MGIQARSEIHEFAIRPDEDVRSVLLNKTTFYKHYQDIYALSEEIEDETILSIMESFEQMNSLFSDPDAFMKGLYYAFKSHEKLILILFSGRMNNLIEKVERLLILHYP